MTVIVLVMNNVLNSVKQYPESNNRNSFLHKFYIDNSDNSKLFLLGRNNNNLWGGIQLKSHCGP